MEEERKVGAPIGNTNSSRNNRMWADTIRRVIVQGDGEALRRVAEALVLKAQEGDIAAIKELGDRLDGKSVATTELTGIDGAELPINIGVTFVKPSQISE